VEKGSLIICAISVFLQNIPKVNSRPIGEISPNLVTLVRVERFFLVQRTETRNINKVAIK
jgi:hypothetical protein